MDYNFANFTEGYGSHSAVEVEQLNKAMEAGAGYAGAPTSLSNGGALQVESLDSSLKSVTYEMKNIKLWSMIQKDQAYNTIEEYNRQDAFGDQGRGFINEGALPRSEDSSYTRQIQRVRFIGVTRELTHVYTLVRNAHGDAMAREIKSGTMRILEIAERALFAGRGFYSAAGIFDGSAAILDADNSFEGSDIQIRKGDQDASAKAKAFSGYGAEESVVIDASGSILDEDMLEDQARIVMENFGDPNLKMMDSKAHSDLSRQFFPKERINNMGVQQGRAGFVLREFDSSAGTFALISDVFLRPKRGPFASVIDGPAAPAAPTAVVAADPNSKFAAADAGSYYYKVTAMNANGEGLASAASAAAVVVAGDKVTLSIGAVAGALAYAAYRSPKDQNAEWEFIGFVAPATVGAGASFIDLNHKLPGLSQSYLFSNSYEVMRYKQLAPLLKLDLAIIATAYRWCQLLYGTPVFYAPRKCSIIENIGRAA